MATYMRNNGGPVDMSKAIPYIKKKIGKSSDKEVTDLIRQTGVVETNPIDRKKPPKMSAMSNQISYGESIDNVIDKLLGEETWQS